MCHSRARVNSVSGSAPDLAGTTDLLAGSMLKHPRLFMDGRDPSTDFIGGNTMKTRLSLLAIALCLSAPLATAAEFSWDCRCGDLESVLPAGVPNEGRVVQARHRVREMAQDTLRHPVRNPTRCTARHREFRRLCGLQHLRGQAVLCRRPPAGAWSSTGAPAARPSCRWRRCRAGWDSACQHQSADLRLRQPAGLEQLHQPGLGVRCPGERSAIAGGPGGMFSGAASVAPGV